MSMPSRSTRLGKGLATLLGEVNHLSSTPSARTTGEVRHIPVDQLEPNPFQPRSDLTSEHLEELVESIRTQGILQPILARPLVGSPQRYQIIAGERRWRAATAAGLHEVPVYLRQMTDGESAAAALVENLQRKDLNPIEEAEGLQRLVNEFGLTHEALGYAISKSRSHITNMLRLLNLPPAVQEALKDAKLTYGHARALLGHPNPTVAAEHVISKGLSVRQTEEFVHSDSRRDVTASDGQRRRKADTHSLEKEFTDLLGLDVRISLSERGRGRVTLSIKSWAQLDEIRRQLLQK